MSRIIATNATRVSSLPPISCGYPACYPSAIGRLFRLGMDGKHPEGRRSRKRDRMAAEITAHRKPEEDELDRKQNELAQLEGELADRELELAGLRSELAAFEGLYLRTVGVLYAELDDLNAKIA